MPSCRNCKALLPLDVIMLFCPECGQSLNLKAQSSKGRAYLNTVDMRRQFIITFIPFLNLFMAHDLGKIKQSIARLVPDLLILLSVYYMLFYPNYGAFFTIIILWIIPSLVMFYFVRRWTLQMNKKVTFLRSLQSLSD